MVREWIRRYFLIIVSISMLFSEITMSISPVAGFISYSLLVAGFLIILSRIDELKDYGKLIICLMIIPILRVTELFISLDFVWRSIVIFSIMLFLGIFYCIKFKINPEFSLKRLYLIPLTLLLGAFFGMFGRQFFSQESGIFVLLLVPLIAFSEEIVFRGIFQNLGDRVYGKIASTILVSALYFIFSLSWGLQIALFMFCISAINCLIYRLTKNLFLPVSISMVLHFFILVA